MRLYEFVNGDQQLIDIIKPILIRAKAEGAVTISTSQILNDLNDKSITLELLINVLNDNRRHLNKIISSANYDEIKLNVGGVRGMTSDVDNSTEKMKSTALKKAKGDL